MEEGLKPCPLCGAKVSVKYDTLDRMWHVDCYKACGYNLAFVNDREAMVKRHNTRPREQALKGE